MLAVMTMDVDRPRMDLRSLDQFSDPIGRNAVVADGQMDVAQAVLARRFHVGLSPIHADDGLHSEPNQFTERSISLRRASRKDIGGRPEKIMQTGRWNRRRYGISGESTKGFSP